VNGVIHPFPHIPSRSLAQISAGATSSLRYIPVFLNGGAAARYRAMASITRAARGSPGICHFSFLSNFHE